ncbi:MAG TPA: hemerythrin domain-containing protein [Bryobacteraceae bacterium]|nr:hemerythrin domain-containing protein [Bryobacteraceae bacterium]
MPVQIGQTAATFADPIGLLKDCHRRIERFLETLFRMSDAKQGAPLGADERTALEGALNYFRDAAPRHTEDEEDSLFPRLMEHAAVGDPVALAMIAELEDGHEQANAAHEEIERLGRRWLAQGSLTPVDAARMTELLCDLRTFYQRHIATEDNELFPLAGRMLDAQELAAVGSEMRARRRLQEEIQPRSAA